MKLKVLLTEGLCYNCYRRLTVDDVLTIKPGFPELCAACAEKDKKKSRLEREEFNNNREIEQAASLNLFNVSNQMPDRSHDYKHGTPGWVMGEPNPGRSF